MYNYGGFGSLTPQDTTATSLLFKLIMLTGIVIGGAMCLFGYKLQKFYVGIMMALIFCSVGVAIGVAMDESMVSVILGLLGLVGGFLLGYKFYKGLMVAMMAVSAFSIGVAFGFILQLDTAPALVLGVIAGVGVGILTHKFLRPIVIISTAYQGATMFAACAYNLVSYEGFVEYGTKVLSVVANNLMGMVYGGAQAVEGPSIIIVLLLTAVGIYVQWKTSDVPLSAFKSTLLGANATGTVSPTAHGEGEAAPIAGEASGNSTPLSANPYIQKLDLPVVLPSIGHITYYLMGACACFALAAVQSLSYFSVFLLDILFGASIILPVVQTKKSIPNTAVHGVFLGAAVVMAYRIVTLLGNGATVTTLLYLAAISTMLVGLWLVIAKNKTIETLFLVAAGTGVVHALIVLVRGGTPLVTVGAVLVSVPFILPRLQALKAQAATKAATPPVQPMETDSQEPQPAPSSEEDNDAKKISLDKEKII